MAAGNYTIIKAKDIRSFKFGGTAWSDAELVSAVTAMDESFSDNNPSAIIDLIGTRDSNNPVESDAWVKEVSFGGNEREVTEEDLLGQTTAGAQNKETVGSTVSSMTVDLTLVYRNNQPLKLFSDNTKCAICEIQTDESATHRVNFAFNDITVTKVGDLSQAADGLMEQTVSFSLSAGTNDGTSTTVTQADPSETWDKVISGDYVEEVRTA